MQKHQNTEEIIDLAFKGRIVEHKTAEYFNAAHALEIGTARNQREVEAIRPNESGLYIHFEGAALGFGEGGWKKFSAMPLPPNLTKTFKDGDEVAGYITCEGYERMPRITNIYAREETPQPKRRSMSSFNPTKNESLVNELNLREF